MAARGSFNPLILGGVAAGLFYAYKTGKLQQIFHLNEKSNIAEMKLRLAGFHAESDGALAADIELVNPTSLTMQVQSIIGNIMVNGRTVGTIKMFGDTRIQGNNQAMIPVNVKIMPAAAALFRRRGERVQFRGEININNHVAPLTMDYTL